MVWIPRVPVHYSLPLSLGAYERNFVTGYSGSPVTTVIITASVL